MGNTNVINAAVINAPHPGVGQSVPSVMRTRAPQQPDPSPFDDTAEIAAIPYNPERQRGGMLLLIPLIIAAGLSTRYAHGIVPHAITDAAGDLLYAMLIALLVALAFHRWPRWKIAGVTVAFCFAVEFSQFYHAPWLDAVRHTLPGALILGSTFVPLDLLWYALGAVVGVSMVPRQQKITRQFRSIRK